MDTLFGGISAPFLSLMTLFFGITAILWFLLPFSIFGVKSRLDEQIRLLRVLDERLKQLHSTISESRTGWQDVAVPITPVPVETVADGPRAPSEPEASGNGDDRSASESGNSGHNGRWQKPDG